MAIVSNRSNPLKRPDRRPLRRLTSSLWLLWLLFLLALPAGAAEDWQYTVRPGDKLWNLAEKYCGTHTRWRDLAAHNALQDPTRLRPGRRLAFPLAWLLQQPASARVVYVRGDIFLIDPNAAGEAPAVPGREIVIGQRLRSGADGFATIEFADGSQFQLAPSSEVVFDRMTTYGDTGMVDTRMRLVSGAGVSRVSGSGSRYRISVPQGVAAVRGTEFRTRTEGEQAFVETLEGNIGFAAPSGDNRDIERGEGLIASAAGLVVEELLPPPAFAAQPASLPGHAQLAWSPLAGASAYVVSVYEDASRTRMLTRARQSASAYPLRDLPGGTLYVSILGVSESGLEGEEATRELRVLAGLPATHWIRTEQPRRRLVNGAPWRDGSSSLQASWQGVPNAERYRVTVSRAGEIIERIETSERSARFDGLANGTVSVTVQALAADGAGGDIEGEIAPAVEQELSPPLWIGLLGLLALAVVAL
ncbi:MAG: FecR domain-containing protein [Pseudomonadota bacterium]